MANEDAVPVGPDGTQGTQASSSEGVSLTGIYPPTAPVTPPLPASDIASASYADNDPQATLIQTRGHQPLPTYGASKFESHSDDIHSPKFHKSVESRIDPEDPPNLLLTEPDLQKIGTIQVGMYTCPLIDQIALIKKLGEGGNGNVFLGYQHRFGEVALKTLKPKVAASDASIVGRFFLEARLSKKFSSPHIVKTYDARTEGTLHFLVMEYIEGTDASGYLKKLKTAAKATGATVGIPEMEALRICVAACNGLAALHEFGVMHRDIKPQNIMIPYGKNKELKFDSSKLMDLGLAKATDDDAQSMMKKDNDPTISGTLLGTPGYMAPEQVMDCSSVSEAADIFSIGATLYCMLCGSPPFRDVQGAVATASATIHGQHQPIAERCLKAKIPILRGTATIIEQCLRKRPNERYTTAKELLTDLERVLRGEEPLAKRRPKKLPKWVWAISGTAAAAVLFIVFIYNPFGTAKLERHTKAIEKAYAALDRFSVTEAEGFNQDALEARIRSTFYTRDAGLMAIEKKLSTKIDEVKATIKKDIETGQIDFKKSVNENRYDDAQKVIDALEKYKASPELDLEQLKKEYASERKKWEIKKAEEEKRRVKELDRASNQVSAALASGDLQLADTNFEQAKKLALKPDELAQIERFRKDIFREKHIVEINAIVSDNKRDIETATTLLAEVKSSEPKHASIADLTSKIETESKRRIVVKSVDYTLSQLTAGTGDLGDVKAALAQLKPDDRDRKSRDEIAQKVLANYTKSMSTAKQLIKDRVDLGAAEKALGIATQLWKSNPDVLEQRGKLEKANEAFVNIVVDFKKLLPESLQTAEPYLAQARKMRPDDSIIAECDAMVAAEKSLQQRISTLQSDVAKLDTKKEFDNFKTELEACLAVRKDNRLTAVKTAYEVRLIAYKEKLLAAAVSELNSELKALGAYGDGTPYAEFKTRIERVAADAATDARIVALRDAFEAKNKDAEEKSVFGVTRNLNTKLAAFQNKALTVKQFEDAVLNAEGQFAATNFTKQRGVLEDAKAQLSKTIADIEAVVAAKGNLDSIEKSITEIGMTYPGFKGLAEAQKHVAQLNAAYAVDVQSNRTKIDAANRGNGSLEGLEDVIARCLKVHPADATLAAIQKDYLLLKDSFAKALAAVPAAAASGNIDDADRQLDAAAKLFPNDASLPIAKQRLADARTALQKELAVVEPILAAPDKGDFAKASETLARIQKRIPNDPAVARLEAARQNTIADTEKLASQLDYQLSLIMTAENLPDSVKKLKQVLLVGPNDKLTAKFNKRKEAYDSNKVSGPIVTSQPQTRPAEPVGPKRLEKDGPD